MSGTGKSKIEMSKAVTHRVGVVPVQPPSKAKITGSMNTPPSGTTRKKVDSARCQQSTANKHTT